MPIDSPFLERLRSGPLLCDGAMGTELYARGISYEQCFEQLNMTQSELIKSIHLEYIAAGAQVIETNTFGANRYRLAKHGLEQDVYEINRAGVRVAREACELSEQPIFLAGNIGPLGHPLTPLGKITPSEARSAFLEQAEALLKAGIDLFLLETFSALPEILEALAAVRSLTTLPVIALMTFSEEGNIASGETPQMVVKALQEAGADVVGANCTFGPDSLLEVVSNMCSERSEALYIAAQPNAGLPQRVGDEFVYSVTPEYFARLTQKLLEQGVRLVGGCCGTTPQHIAAMRDVMASGERTGLRTRYRV